MWIKVTFPFISGIQVHKVIVYADWSHSFLERKEKKFTHKSCVLIVPYWMFGELREFVIQIRILLFMLFHLYVNLNWTYVIKLRAIFSSYSRSAVRNVCMCENIYKIIS